MLISSVRGETSLIDIDMIRSFMTRVVNNILHRHKVRFRHESSD